MTTHELAEFDPAAHPAHTDAEVRDVAAARFELTDAVQTQALPGGTTDERQMAARAEARAGPSDRAAWTGGVDGAAVNPHSE